MKNALSITSTLILGCALALTACSKDKKAAKTDPSTVEPAKPDPVAADPAKPDPAAPKADDKPKDDKGGW